MGFQPIRRFKTELGRIYCVYIEIAGLEQDAFQEEISY